MNPQTISWSKVCNLGNRQGFALPLHANVNFGSDQIEGRSVRSALNPSNSRRQKTKKQNQAPKTKFHTSYCRDSKRIQGYGKTLKDNDAHKGNMNWQPAESAGFAAIRTVNDAGTDPGENLLQSRVHNSG